MAQWLGRFPQDPGIPSSRCVMATGWLNLFLVVPGSTSQLHL